MADGTEKNIEDVKVGEEVIIYNELLNTKLASPVTEVLHHEPRMEEIYTVTLDDGTVIKPNNEHPMYEATSKTYITMWDLAKKFDDKYNPTLLKEDWTTHTIKSITMEKMSIPTYNLHVLGISNNPNIISVAGIGHNYYANGILVHNNMITWLFIEEADALQQVIIQPTT